MNSIIYNPTSPISVKANVKRTDNEITVNITVRRNWSDIVISE